MPYQETLQEQGQEGRQKDEGKSCTNDAGGEMTRLGNGSSNKAPMNA